MAAKVATLIADMRLESAAFLRDIAKTSNATSQAAQKMQRSFESAAGFMRGALEAVVSVETIRRLVEFSRQAIENAAAIKQQAAALGVSSDSLQAFHFAAQQAGVGLGSVDTALTNFTKSLGDARAGTGALFNALRYANPELLRQLQAAKGADEALNTLFGSLDRTANANDRARTAAAAFGFGWRNVIKIIGEGGDAFRESEERARNLGIILSRDVLAKADLLSRQINILGQVARTGFDTGFIEGFFGALDTADESLKTLNNTMREFGQAVGESFKAATELAGQLLAILQKINAIDIAGSPAELGTFIGGQIKRRLQALGILGEGGPQALSQEAMMAQLGVTAPAAPAAAGGGLAGPTDAALKYNEEITRAIEQTKQLGAAIGFNAAAYQQLEDHIKAVNIVTGKGIDENSDYGRSLIALTEQNLALQRSNELLLDSIQATQQAINSFASSAISQVSSAFADAVVNGENFRDMLDGLLKDLARLALNTVFQLLLRQIVGQVGVTGGAAGTGLLGATGLHGGGIVGSGGMRRSVPAIAYMGAPRFHSGFAAGEYPAILRRGEGVFTPEQMKAMGGGTVNNFTVVNQVPGTTVNEDRQRNSSGGTDITVFIRQAMTKEISDPASAVHKSLKANFGLAQAGIRR